MKSRAREKHINKILLKKNNSIFDAVKSLNKTNYQVCLIVDDKKKLLGTITDGDIRRSIIKKINFNNSVIKIMNKKPVFIREGFDVSSVEKLMKKKSVLQLPVVNKQKEVVNLVVWKDDKTNNNRVIIMAGGLGKRLRPLTSRLPKPMIKIKNKPILEHIINKLKSQGFNNVTISVRYLAKTIKNFFKNGKNFGVNINYLHEKKVLGTAGSLSLIKPKKNEDDYIIINADTIFDLNLNDLINFHKKKNSLLTMAIRQEFFKSDYGIIKSKGYKFDKIEEKPIITTYVNAGIYIVSKKVLKNIKKNKYLDMPDLFNELKKKKNKKIFLFPIYENYQEVGTLKDLKKLI